MWRQDRSHEYPDHRLAHPVRRSPHSLHFPPFHREADHRDLVEAQEVGHREVVEDLVVVHDRGDQVVVRGFREMREWLTDQVLRYGGCHYVCHD